VTTLRSSSRGRPGYLWLRVAVLSLRGGFYGHNVRCPVHQWLTAQGMSDGASLLGGSRGCVSIFSAEEITGVVEQTVGKVVRRAQLAQAGDGGREGCGRSSRAASGSRDSDNRVNPTRSQNSTEHTRRSATGAQSRPPPAAVPDDAGARSDS
jgi:hypothetical protein